MSLPETKLQMNVQPKEPLMLESLALQKFNKTRDSKNSLWEWILAELIQSKDMVALLDTRVHSSAIHVAKK